VPFHPTLGARLAQDFPIRQGQRHAHYLATYKLFLRFFKERIAVNNLQPDDAKTGVVLVYSWMTQAELQPTCWKHFASAKKLLRQDKTRRLTASEVDALRAFVGGSLIATSKYLHLFNPSRYAMWDTNVARAAYRYSWQQCNQSERYIEYLDDINDLHLHAALRERIRQAIGKSSAVRCKEFALFQLGLAESTPPSYVSELSIADYALAPEKYTEDLDVEDDPGVSGC